MKSIELTIGSIVSIKGNEAKRVKVNGITKKKIQCINEKNQPEYYRYSQLVPVLLDDNIIKDLGFERRIIKVGSEIIDDWIIVLSDKKDKNKFYQITLGIDKSLGNKKEPRSIFIDNWESLNIGSGNVMYVHELQSFVHVTSKLRLDTKKLCGNS